MNSSASVKTTRRFLNSKLTALVFVCLLFPSSFYLLSRTRSLFL